MIKYLIMQGVARTRVLLFLIGLIVVPTITAGVILFARGYRPDFTNRQLQPTGLLVANSYPDGAQIYVNSQLKSATNTTFNLAPGEYDIEIKKDGFYPWRKHVQVQAEIVTRATAVLFPTIPALKAVTSTGASFPIISPDGSRVIFFGGGNNRNNLYTLDLSESPLGLLNRDSKLLTSSITPQYHLSWSPDSRQILASASSSAYLIDLLSSQTSNVTDSQTSLIDSWIQREKIKSAQQFSTLPLKLQPVLATAAADLVWSPRENKLLYTATASATLPDEIIRPLPGSSTQPQHRTLIPGQVYVFDLEEDRNFLIDQPPLSSPTPSTKTTSTPPLLPNSGWRWFPTSSHLIRVSPNQVTLIEYDNQNQVTIYAGPMSESVAFPYPSGRQLLILADLNTTPAPTGPSLPQLYAIPLR